MSQDLLINSMTQYLLRSSVQLKISRCGITYAPTSSRTLEGKIEGNKRTLDVTMISAGESYEILYSNDIKDINSGYNYSQQLLLKLFKQMRALYSANSVRSAPAIWVY